MSEQLSKIYRQALASGRDAAVADAEVLLALDEVRDAGAPSSVLDRLAAMPDAAALVAFARDCEHESRLLALEMRRADAVQKSWQRPRRRRSFAAAAALAALALAVPLALQDGSPGDAPDLRMSSAHEVDDGIILAASFENGRRDSVGGASDNGNGAIFSSRFDG